MSDVADRVAGAADDDGRRPRCRTSAAPDDGRDAPAAGDDGGVAGQAAAAGEHAGRLRHAGTSSGEVSARTRSTARPVGGQPDGVGGGGDDLAGRQAGEAGEPAGEGGEVAGAARRDRRRVGEVAAAPARTACSRVSGKSGSSAMSTAMRSAACGLRLPGAHLQHPERALLDGELDVAHVGVVPLEGVGVPPRSAATAGARSSSTAIGSVWWVPATTSSPWAPNITSPKRRGAPVDGLRVNSDAGAGAVAAVAEDHRLHRHGGAQVVGDALDGPVGLRALAVPGAEHRLDRRARSWAHGSSGTLSPPTTGVYMAVNRRRQSARTPGRRWRRRARRRCPR